MEFAFNINHLFGETISVVDSRLLPCKNHSLDDLQGNLERVIDDMGEASAKAQGLNGAITSAHRMRYSNHKLYVVKDGSANRGAGSVVGIIKIGRKKLFVLDKHGNQNEMEPLCVLDFYVHESCQRKGYGKRLFEHILQVENIRAQHIAIDRPSPKFTSFLMKHYNLRATIAQVNNFVIFEGFFTNQPEESYCRNRRLGSAGKPPIAPNTRQGSSKPHGGYRNASRPLWSAGSGSPLNQRRISNPEEVEALMNVKISPVNLNRSVSAGSLSSTGSGDGMFAEQGMDSSRGQAAHATHYSRYELGTTPSRSRSNSKTRESPLAASPARNTPPNAGNVRAGLRSRENTPPFGAVGSRMLNSHVNTQGRGGHLKVAPKATPTTNHYESPSQPQMQASGNNNIINVQESPSNSSQLNTSDTAEEVHTTPEGNYNLCVTWKPRNMHSSWNVMGIPPSGAQSNAPKSRHRTTNMFY
ncbi:uncharacterized protein [Amphiura filiformis]|uniref:uncharacterized protein n=1 Tax=Amphiura filiformis TaxID=82378 RepID=UPI003B214788